MCPSDLLTFLAFSCAIGLIASHSKRSSLESLLMDHDRIHKDDVTILSSYSNYRKLQFNTLNRKFSLHVRPHTDIFASHFKVFVEKESGSRSLHTDFDPTQFYKGYVEGESESHVAAHVDNEGIITATISLPHDTYVIEPSWRHVPVPHSYHMIAYRRSDIKLQLGKRFDNGSYSGKFCQTEGHGDDHSQFVHSDFLPYRQSLLGHVNVGKRLRRSIPVLNTCEVILVADYSFYKYFGNSDVSATVHYMVSSMVGVDNIFRRTQFSDGFEGMGMNLKEVIVHDAPNTTNPDYYNYYNENIMWKVSAKLAAFSSTKKWQDACLAHLFTYQDFEDGVLGLAYVASSQRSTVGGICSPLYRGFRSLRVGLTTPVNYGRNLLREEVDVVTAHGIHNITCDNQYPVSITEQLILLQNLVTIGEAHMTQRQVLILAIVMVKLKMDDFLCILLLKTERNKFSTCSKTSIAMVLGSKSSRCFNRNIGKLCGNYVVEEDEACDAGFLGDQCCDTNCQLVQGAVCSDANAMCCSNCKIAPTSKMCRKAADNNLACENDTYCGGELATCPDKIPKRVNDSSCGTGGICKNGNCINICKQHYMVSCECLKDDQKCLICCATNSTSLCSPLQLDTANGSSSVTSMELKVDDGSFCNNFQGMCLAGKCEDIVQDPLERFWDVITNISLDRIAEWFRDNIVAAVLIFSLIIWVPASLTIYYFDCKRIKKIKEAENEYRNVTDPELRVHLQSTAVDKWAIKPMRKPSKRAIDQKPLISSSREV
ncbi:ADAM 17-like protease [Corticium candelabrum]|uniref:ADAM 17-like protease n=1 Tax=Corticium candelabrum TaxID=121492 RepID=UPI002E27632B|nr:ADAM 17-like protease [Corticium candelabrum]